MSEAEDDNKHTGENFDLISSDNTQFSPTHLTVSNFTLLSHPDAITTVAENQTHFTKKQIAQAIGAQCIQQYNGWQSTSTFISYIKQNLLVNCSVTVSSECQHLC